MTKLRLLRRSGLITGAALFLNLSVDAFQRPGHVPLANFDHRQNATANGRPLQEQVNVAVELRARVPGIRIEFGNITGAPKLVSARDGFLTGPGGGGRAVLRASVAGIAANDPHRTTKAFLREHSPLFGHGPEALDSARVTREFTTAHNGMKTVVWHQQVDGVLVFEGMLIAHTTARGELVNISSQFMAAPEAAADRGADNRAALLAAPMISAARAVALAADNLGEETGAAQAEETTKSAGADRHQKFRAAFLRGEAEARLVWLPLDRNTLRLCWDVILRPRGQREMFRVLVDARSGECHLRRCLTSYSTNATYRVFTSDSPSPFSPGHPTPLTNQPPIIPRMLVTLEALDTNASPAGWIQDGANETLGNNVDAHTDLTDDDFPDLPRPAGSPFRVFDFPLDLALPPNSYRAASVAQLFYVCNWAHDKLYELGFTEAAGNFQQNNFERGGAGHDALQADAQDGGGYNNANMSVPPDGSSPRMQMYVFDGPNPDVDGDLDAEIVIHEYVHGLSHRRIGGGAGLNTAQSAGMGEGWSDWYSLALLSEAGDGTNGNYAAGAYATYRLGGQKENYYYGIRRYPYSTDMTKNPLTFQDIDPDQASTHPGIPSNPLLSGGNPAEVHNQGEVWCVTLWDARANLIAKHGFTNGNQLILQLVTDGMNLSPPNPNFLQARDAILLADQVLTGGANRRDLWAAFARRGMGVDAISPDSFTTEGVVESFEVPDVLSVSPPIGFSASGPVAGPFVPDTVTFTLTNTGDAPLEWTLSNTSIWLNVSQTNGVLAAGGPATTVTVDLNPIALTFPRGLYRATIRFTNMTTGAALGRVFTLRAIGGTFFDDFEPAIDFVQWDALSTRVRATNYGGKVSGVNSLWFGGNGSRFAETRPLDTHLGGTVEFFLRLADGNDEETEVWEWVDLPSEGVVLEYSTNGGLDWVEFGRYDTNNFYVWTQVREPIPTAAQTVSTKFRWRQLGHSGASRDHWALDDVEVLSGLIPPEIRVQPVNRFVEAGGSAQFTVRVGGDPPLSFQWRKEGTDLPGATNITFTITGAHSNDVGGYAVVVTNLYGSTTSLVATLTILPASSFVAVFNDPRFVDVGNTNSEADNVEASLDFRGIAVTTFTNILDAAGRYRGLVFPKQEINLLAPQLGTAERSALSNFVSNGGTLIVHGGSLAAGQLVNAVSGHALQELTVVKYDYPEKNRKSSEASGTQFEDDPEITLANNQTWALLRESLPAGALSIYTNFYGSTVVVIEQGSGVIIFLGWDWFDAAPLGVRDEGWIAVLESAALQSTLPLRPPVLVEQPRSGLAAVGGVVRFRAAPVGSAPLSCQWQKNGTNLPFTTNPELILPNVQLSDAGTYRLVVTNPYGSTTGSIITLTVLTNTSGPVAVFGGGLESWNIDVQTKIRETGLFPRVDQFMVETYDPVPTLNDLLPYSAVLVYSANNDGVRIGDALADYVDAGGGVVVGMFSFHSNGITGRLLTNNYLPFAFGEFIGGTQVTLIPDLPEHPILARVTSFDGGRLGYHQALRMTSNSTQVAHWSDDTPLVGTKEMPAGRVVGLNFPPPSSDARDDHWLSATDGGQLIGNALFWAAQSSASNAPPRITVQPRGQSVRPGTNVSFSVTVLGSQPRSYQWRKNGVDVVDDDRITGALTPLLNINRTAENDSGTYTLIVSNAFGSTVSTNAMLLVSALDHFAWAPIPSPQIQNEPFVVTVRAEDDSNQVVTSFQGIVKLSAFSSALSSNYTILPAPFPSYTAPGGLTIGYAFTPNTTITITAVRHYFGTKVSIWTDDGILLAAQPVASVFGTWQETPLDLPLTLSGGATYRVGAFSRSGYVAGRSDLSPSFAHGTIDQACFTFADLFPDSPDSDRWAFVDLRYVPGDAAFVPTSPTLSGDFTNGIWTGIVTLTQAAANAELRASDGLSHKGNSMAMRVIERPAIQTERLGDRLRISWSAAASNFHLEATDSLAPASWQLVMPEPVLVGEQLVVSINMDQARRFYRLRRAP